MPEALSKKLRVAVLMGGPSAEHEVSLNTGEMVFSFLDKEKYAPKRIVVSKNGRWPVSFSELKNSFDVAFIAMHGEYGEDGALQKILEKLKIPYTGSDSKTSKIGINKIACHKLFKTNHLLSPKYTISQSLETIKKLGLPLVIKPIDRGSSVGVSIINNWQSLPTAIKTAERYSKKIMFQEYISGREFTCGVVQIKNKIVPLAPTEIIPIVSSFFDYKAKYTTGASQEITPPNLSLSKIKEIQKIALKVHESIGRTGYSRTDLIMDKKGGFYVLEINTLPGLTETSLVPQGAKATNITFPQLLDTIIEAALNKEYTN